MPVQTAERFVKFHFDQIHFAAPLAYGPFLLAQAGDVAAEPGYVCETHTQSVYELSYVVSGRGTFFVDGQPFLLQKDMLFLNRIGERHKIVSDLKDPIRYYYLGFLFSKTLGDDDPVRRIREAFDRPDVRLVSNAASIEPAFSSLFDNLLCGDAFAEGMMEAALRQILVTSYRLFFEKTPLKYDPRSIAVKNKILSDMIHYLDRHLCEIDALSHLPEAFSYSYSYLANLFHKFMGQSLRAYFLSRRMELAERYLSEGNSVTATAELLGYQSIHSFSHAFLKHCGISPQAIKNKRKEESL